LVALFIMHWLLGSISSHFVLEANLGIVATTVLDAMAEIMMSARIVLVLEYTARTTAMTTGSRK
jgi:hypothetical protein